MWHFLCSDAGPRGERGIPGETTFVETTNPAVAPLEGRTGFFFPDRHKCSNSIENSKEMDYAIRMLTMTPQIP